MANAEGPASKGRVYEFMSNGGGAITTRMALIALCTISTALIGLMWNDLKDGQKLALQTITDQGKIIAVNSSRLDGMQSSQHAAWDRLDSVERVTGDLGTRVTRLESCQPHCAPR